MEEFLKIERRIAILFFFACFVLLEFGCKNGTQVVPDQSAGDQGAQKNRPSQFGPQPSYTYSPGNSFRSPVPFASDGFVVVNSDLQVSGLARWMDSARSASNKTPCTMFVVNRYLLTARHCVKWGTPERISTATGRIIWSTQQEKSASELQSTLKLGEGDRDYAVLGPFTWGVRTTDYRFALAPRSSPLPSRLTLRGHPFNPERPECRNFMSSPDLMFECGSRPQQEIGCSQVRQESNGEISAICEAQIRSGLSGSPLFDPQNGYVFGILSSAENGGRAFFTSVVGLIM